MQLGDLLPRSYTMQYGRAVLSLRFTLSSFLSLEQQGYDYKIILSDKITGTALLAFFLAGVQEDIGKERAMQMIQADHDAVWAACREAMLLALPEYDPLTIPDPELEGKSSEGIDWFKLRMLICDEMGKSEEFFWSSTLRELTQRWETYAYAKGYAEPPQKMKRLKDMSPEEAQKWLDANL